MQKLSKHGDRALPHYPEYVQINDRSIELAVRAACNPMHTIVDPGNDGLPYFGNIMSGDDPRNYHHVDYSLSHVPGRWLSALLTAEDVFGIHPPATVIENLRKWAFRSVAHPMGISQSMNLDSFEIIPLSNLHNLREIAHAFWALAYFRNDDKAVDAVLQQIRTVDRYLDYETGVWDEEAFVRERAGRTNYSTPKLVRPFPFYFGRYIGPLVKLYRDCGLTEAGNQASALVRLAFNNVLFEDGAFVADRFGDHTHSTTSMLSGLALYGQVMGDESVLKRVHAFVQNGLNEISIPTGWCIERVSREDDVGECNNTGDILETLLILADAGWDDLYQRAEQIIRGHLLPAQLLDTSFVTDFHCPDDDGRHHLATRAHGAFGFPCPYGHEFLPGSRISFN